MTNDITETQCSCGGDLCDDCYGGSRCIDCGTYFEQGSPTKDDLLFLIESLEVPF